MNSSYLKCYMMVVAVIRSHSHDQTHDSYSVSVVSYAVNNNLVAETIFYVLNYHWGICS